jgi:putative ubiquitin-RnfH superfamily antitoxin RatB of RatAB toxin-antitoxin module
MKIEVIYALPERQELVTLDLPEGSNVQQAIEASGLLGKYPDIEPGGKNKLGVFAKLVKPEAVLRERDRVEIYRPLIADPKEVRRQKAAEGKVMKRGAAELNAGEAGEAQ